MTAPALRRPCDCSARTRRRCAHCGGSGWCVIWDCEAAAALAEVLDVPLGDGPARLRAAADESARLQARAIAAGDASLAALAGNEALLLRGVAGWLEARLGRREVA